MGWQQLCLVTVVVLAAAMLAAAMQKGFTVCPRNILLRVVEIIWLSGSGSDLDLGPHLYPGLDLEAQIRTCIQSGILADRLYLYLDLDVSRVVRSVSFY